MATITEKYHLYQEGKVTGKELLQEMRKGFPQYISQFNGIQDSIQILKNKGILFEQETPGKTKEDLPPEAIWRGVSVELTRMGKDPVTCSDPVARERAEEIATANLLKDPLYYINRLAGEKPKKTEEAPKQEKLQEQETPKEEVEEGCNMKPVQKKKIKEDHTSNSNDKYVVKPCKMGGYAVWEGDVKVKMFADKERAQKFAAERNSKEDKKQQLKESLKKVILETLKEGLEPLQEHVTAPDNLAQYIDYKAPNNPELAMKVRESAKKLSDYIYKFEKQYLDARDNIEELYKEVGGYMAPAVRQAFLKDLQEVFASYGQIPVPKSRFLSPEEEAKLRQKGVNINKDTF